MDYKIIELETTLSTNTYAKNLLAMDEANEGTVIYAREQSSGRGLGNNCWESEAGKNLTISLILRPDFLAASDQFMITKVVSLALVDYLQSVGIKPNVKIKWPNDIYVDLKKIAGILIENDISGDNISCSVAGIGLNVNQEFFLSNAPNPVSIKTLLNKDTTISLCLASILSYIHLRYKQLKERETDRLDKEYLQNLLFYNELHQFVSGGVTFTGIIVDVDKFGRLLLKMGRGGLKLFGRKEISFII